MKLRKKILSYFRKEKILSYWVVDDDTPMPILCSTEQQARELVKKEFNGEYERIFEMGYKL